MLKGRLVKNISIALCVKEYYPKLTENILSYLAQTLKPIDLVIVADSFTVNKLKRNLGTQKLIKFVRFNGNKNAARNISIKYTKGDYVIYVDHDMIAPKNLISECVKLLYKYNSIFIPEVGIESGNLYARIFKLEKTIASNDKNALTPRLFKKSLFKNGETIFEEKFGVLDEWGFYLNLKKKKPRIGTLKKSYLTVSDQLTIKDRIYRSYLKGIYAISLTQSDPYEAKRRFSVIGRGFNNLKKNYKLFITKPIEFSLLTILKILELIGLKTGLIMGNLKKIYK